MQLAMVQTHMVRDRLQALHPELKISIGSTREFPLSLQSRSLSGRAHTVSMKTIGDIILDRPLANVCQSFPVFIQLVISPTRF
jgi:porphobilinogen deaminase